MQKSYRWLYQLKKINTNNKMNFSSIVNEVIRAIYYFFYKDILHTQKACKAPKQRLLRYPYTPKSIIIHTGDFDLDITPKSIKNASDFLPRYFYTLKKRCIKIVAHDVINNFCSRYFLYA